VAAAQTGPVVAVTGGEIRGQLTSDGGAAFKGVPFARPPVGDLRWREPQPVEPWTGVRDAVTFRPACPQLSQGWNIEDTKNSAEDCLYLNIAAPEWPPKKAWPVLYWIHGGSNTAGSGEAAAIDERALVRHGVIFVTVNYRLGALGFLAHPELTRESPHQASGNYGLMDQIAGLQWVRDNIAKFGGDPANVTIAGESAGAYDVGLLMTSPLAKGLFHRAIAESGAVAGFDGSLPAARAEEKGLKLATSLKAPAEGAIGYLRTLPPEKILEAARTLAAGDWTGLETSVDGWVLREPPMQVFAEGRSEPVPLITGSNAHETGQNEPAKKLQERIRKAYGALAGRALPFYQAADPLYGPPGVQWSTDYVFRCPSAAEALWHARGGAPTYEYEFEKPVPGQAATRHASELTFVFGLWRNTSPTEMDKKVADQVQTYWTNFARTGDPNGKDLPNWPKFTQSEQSYLAFTAQGAAAKADMRRKPCELFIEFRQAALPPPPYRNPRLTVEERTSDLLKRMTLEEKAAELIPDLRPELLDTTGQYDTQHGRMALLMLGSPMSKTSPHDMAVLRNAVQRYRLEKTRLGIPQIFMGELLHGFMSHGATSFPQALALASTWDPPLIRQVFTAAADEMASTGVRQAFTPVLDLARDPRWGRTEET
jgi:para-nitrobenzyl esterase